MAALKRFLPGKPALILIGAFAIVVVLVMTRDRKVPEPARERSWVVDVVTAEPATMNPTLEVFGVVQSPQDAELSAAVEAIVTRLAVRDGETVEEGQTLIELDGRDARFELQQAEADLKEVSAQLRIARIRLTRSRQAAEKEGELLAITADRARRADEIFSEGLLSKSDMDTASENLARQQLALNQAELAVEENEAKITELEARMARLRALRDRANLDLERTVIKAPFPGVISAMQVSEGDRVRPGDKLMRLQNPNSIEVRAQLPTRFARAISEGMQESANVAALVEVEDRRLEGRVERVSGQTNEASGGVDSFIGFGDDVTGLRLGSTVRVLLELPAEQNVIAVPGEAVYGSDRVYKLNEGRMQPVTVERVGEREYADGRTEVLLRSAEISAGDRIVVTKLANASEGLLVRTEDDASEDGETRPMTAQGL